MWSKGYRLHTALEPNGNTVLIYEQRDDASHCPGHPGHTGRPLRGFKVWLTRVVIVEFVAGTRLAERLSECIAKAVGQRNSG
jgi:hypothetical protein